MPKMKPYYKDVAATIYHGDVLDVLPSLPEKSVQCVITSPPYWGLRSYLPDGHDDKPKELGLEPTPDCGTRGLVKLRDDLTADETVTVMNRLRESGLL